MPISMPVSPAMKTLLLALLAAVSLSACAPRFYDRSTVVIDGLPEDEAIQVRYGDLDGCLLKQQVPVEYTLRRPRYTLVVRPVAGLDSAPRIELKLKTEGDARLVFPNLAEAPQALYAEQGSRYVVDTTLIPDHVLHLQVQRGAESLGQESLRFSNTHCRMLSPTGG